VRKSGAKETCDANTFLSPPLPRLAPLRIEDRGSSSEEATHDPQSSFIYLRNLPLEVIEHLADITKAHGVVAEGEGSVISHFLGRA
jgi:hypothetical protein